MRVWLTSFVDTLCSSSQIQSLKPFLLAIPIHIYSISSIITIKLAVFVGNYNYVLFLYVAIKLVLPNYMYFFTFRLMFVIVLLLSFCTRIPRYKSSETITQIICYLIHWVFAFSVVKVLNYWFKYSLRHCIVQNSGRIKLWQIKSFRGLVRKTLAYVQ